MKQEFFQEIDIPEGVEATIDGNLLNVKGPEGENKREFNIHNLVFEKKDNKIIIGSKKATKKEKRMTNTTISHVKNMLGGVKEKFEYELKVVFSHFPMNVSVEGDKVIIKNFLGEKIPRKADIPKGAEVDVQKDTIIVKSVDKEIAGQAAANLETATKIRARDQRVFQDGIYIIKKAGKEI